MNNLGYKQEIENVKRLRQIPLFNKYVFFYFSYGILFGIGCAMVRETSTLMLSQYFKRKREVVEMIASTGTGCGIAIFSNVYRSGME